MCTGSGWQDRRAVHAEEEQQENLSTLPPLTTHHYRFPPRPHPPLLLLLQFAPSLTTRIYMQYLTSFTFAVDVSVQSQGSLMNMIASIFTFFPSSLTNMQRLWTLAETTSARAVAKELELPHIFVRRAIADERLLFCQARRIDPDSGNVIECDWPACLDAEQAERIKAGRRAGKRGYQRPHAGGLLTSMDIFTCGYCGRTIRSWNNHRLRPSGKTDIYSHYGCKANETKRLCERSRLIPQESIDERVVTNLLSTISRADELRAYWAAANTGCQAVPTQDPEKQLNHLLAKKQRLTAAIVEGLIDFADAKKARSAIDAEMETIKAQRQAAMKTPDTKEPDWDNLVLTRDEWQEMTATERRTVIAGAVKNISLYASYLIMEYRFPRTPSGEVTTRIHLPPALRSGRKPAETTPPEK